MVNTALADVLAPDSTKPSYIGFLFGNGSDNSFSTAWCQAIIFSIADLSSMDH